MLIRILTSTTLLFFVLFAPFWLYSILLVLGMIYFSFFLEAVFMFLIAGLLYGYGAASWLGGFFFFSIFIFALLEFVKKKTNFQKHKFL